MLQEGTNQRDLKILPSQLRRLPVPLLLYELEQESEGVSRAGDRMGTDLLLADKPLGEELLEHKRHAGGSVHGGTSQWLSALDGPLHQLRTMRQIPIGVTDMSMAQVGRDEAIRSRHAEIHADVPILAIYALPHERGITDPARRAEADARDLAFQGAMVKAFEKGLPSARVVWLPHADQYVFHSNEADVIREMIRSSLAFL